MPAAFAHGKVREIAMQYRGKSGFGILLSASLLLSACGGGDSDTGSNGITSISGSAATGAAMTSGTVELSCKDGLKKTGIVISATGTWGTTVPTANLPCAVKASDGTNTYYSFTVGNGSSIVTNVTPLTTLALAQILGATPGSLFASLSATDLAKLNDSAITAAISALNTALASYALPAGFNPVTTPLTAAAPGQTGNAYDGLLDQFRNALGATTLDSLITSAATGILPTLPTPSYTPAAANLGGFFTTFAGDYTLKVSNSGAEGSNNATAIALFPQDHAITVHLKDNGDVSIDAVGRTISYLASTYAGNSTGSTVIARTEFMANESGKNVVRYRSANGLYLDLYITYDPSNGKLEVDPQGFVNTEGYAVLKGSIFVPPPAPPAASCSTGDDKLLFTDGPADFCGFTRNASANSIPHYYQFTSTAGSHGVTYVKFDMNSDDTAVTKVTIENDAYAFVCGLDTACNGVTVTSSSGYKQFTLNNTTLAVLSGASQAITVNGLLIHPTGSAGSGDSGSQSGSISFGSSGTSTVAASISTLVGSYTGTIGRVFDTGLATVETTACTITVAANGDITVASGSKTVSAAVNGDVGDVITGPINTSLYKVQASDTSNDKYAEVTIVNGYVTAAVARNSGTGFSTATDRVECKISNPHASTAGTLATSNIANGATAANLDSSYVGTFSNGTCTLTVSAAGVFHLVAGAQDITTSLGGDQDDILYLYPGFDAVAMEARDYFAGGQEIYISFNRTGTVFQADAAIDQPRPKVTLVNGSSCNNLIKQ